MTELLLLNRRPFLYVILPCRMMDVGQVCTSSAYQMNAKRQSSRHTYIAPDPRFVYRNAHQRPSYKNKFESKI